MYHMESKQKLVEHTICKICKRDIKATDEDGNRACPVCCSKEFETILVDPSIAKCSDCGKLGKDSEYYPNLPFYNAKNNTYYCGCYGWG